MSSEIVLTKEQYEKLPYKDTVVTKGKTYGEIVGMLEDHGITDYIWAKLKGTDVLAFPLTIQYGDHDVSFKVKMTVPRLMYMLPVGKGRNAPKKLTYLENQSWRIFWWYLKSKLEAIEFGISDEIKEFLYNVTYALPNGREIQLGPEIVANAEQLAKMIALPEKQAEEVPP